MSKLITAFFTNIGTPATGLSPTIRIRDALGGNLLITDDAMAEVGDGWYRYQFATYVNTGSYAIRCDGGIALPTVDRFSFVFNDNFVDETVTGSWNANAGTFNTTGTMGAIQNSMLLVSSSVDTVFKIEAGSWVITGSQMVLRTSGSDAEIARFNLQDANGNAINPASENPFRRARV